MHSAVQLWIAVGKDDLTLHKTLTNHSETSTNSIEILSLSTAHYLLTLLTNSQTLEYILIHLINSESYQQMLAKNRSVLPFPKTSASSAFFDMLSLCEPCFLACSTAVSSLHIACNCSVAHNTSCKCFQHERRHNETSTVKKLRRGT